jgi:hypothetical protein
MVKKIGWLRARVKFREQAARDYGVEARGVAEGSDSPIRASRMGSCVVERVRRVARHLAHHPDEPDGVGWREA